MADDEQNVELLTPAYNYAVVQLPGRRYPGVVFQGDSLSILMHRLQDANKALQEGRTIEAAAILSHYEDVLEKRGITLPYAKRPRGALEGDADGR